MKKLTTLTQALVLVLGVSASMIGCQKTRKAELPYGADRELLTLSTFDKKEYEIQTKDLIKKSQTANQVAIEDNRSSVANRVKNFDYVDYTANDPLNLTDSTLMLGRPNHKYGLKYEFEGNLLKVMKVAKPEDLATDEMASSQDAGQGLRMVPIVSYAVSYFSLDHTRNERNEKSARLELVGQQSKGAATHFKVDLNSKTRALFLSKTTVLSANYFTSEELGSDWYYALTVVSQNYNEKGMLLGSINSFDKYGKTASKVRAKKTEDKFEFYNLGIDDRLVDQISTRQEIQALAITIPADLVDYRMGETGKTSTVKEESHKEQAWEKRAFAILKLKEIKIPGFDLKVSELKDIQIDDGYFSFSVHSDAVGGLVRISLMNAKHYQQQQIKMGAKPYAEKIYFKEDQNIFGFFETTKNSFNTFDRSKTSQAEKLTVVNRYNPTRQSIEFRLNHSAPQWIEEIAKHAASAWNASFNAAGSPIRIQLLDKEGKVLRGHAGDLRYSLMNFYSDIDGAGPWGGYGPRLVDSTTGEIIMATSNMNLADFVTSMESTLNHYLLAQRGKLDTKYIQGVPLSSLQSVQDTANKMISFVGHALGIKSSINKFDPKTKSFAGAVVPYYDQFSKKIVTDMKLHKSTAQDSIHFGNQAVNENRFNQINGNIQKQVELACPALLAQSKLQENEEADLPLIKECAVVLVKPILISVLLHEMGHNLGLRHNFYGSTDYKNFYGKVDLKVGDKSIETQWKSSTVMDYLPLDQENLTQPGLYDIAALRWGYEDSIEDASGNVVKLKTDVSTLKQIGKNRKPYKYCTDENVDLYQVDPLCARQDTAVSPPLTKEEIDQKKEEPNRILEIVQGHINSYEANVALRNNRMGRDAERDMFDLALARYKNFIQPMKGLYDQWRYKLGNVAGPGNEYLERFDTPEKYNALVMRAIDPAVVGRDNAIENKHYFEASQKIYDFLTHIAFIPDYSCITKRQVEGGEYLKMFSFSKIQQVIFNQSQYTAQSCQDEKVIEYLKKQFNASVIAEGGQAFENIYSDFGQLETSNTYYRLAQKPEVVGFAQDRAFALSALTSRGLGLYYNNLKLFLPNFMDEVRFRTDLINKTSERLELGASLDYFGVKGGAISSYESEKPILSYMMEFIKEGLFIPNKENESLKNTNSLSIAPYYVVDATENTKCTVLYGMRYCAIDDNGQAAKLIKAYENVQNIKLSEEIPQNFAATISQLTKGLVEEKSEDLTVGFLFTISDIAEKYKGNKDVENGLLILQQVLEQEIMIVSRALNKKIGKLRSEDIYQKEINARRDELRKIKFSDALEYLGETDKYKGGLNKATLEKRIQQKILEIQSQKMLYSLEKNEIDAKADILLQTLMRSITYR